MLNIGGDASIFIHVHPILSSKKYVEDSITPSKAPHKMVFLEDSVFIAISELSRVQENYEADTKRLPDNFHTILEIN
jgi:hypothetical protein